MFNMAKYFCNTCLGITFSLRYMTSGKWAKPKGLPQYCKKCNVIEPQKQCIVGLNKIKRMREVNT